MALVQMVNGLPSRSAGVSFGAPKQTQTIINQLFTPKPCLRPGPPTDAVVRIDRAALELESELLPVY